MSDNGGASVDAARADVVERLRERQGELARAGRSPQQRRAEHVRRLLEGATAEQAELGYQLGGCHLGMIPTGTAPGLAYMRRLQAASVRRKREWGR